MKRNVKKVKKQVESQKKNRGGPCKEPAVKKYIEGELIRC